MNLKGKESEYIYTHSENTVSLYIHALCCCLFHQVVGLGVRGVFTIIQDLWKTLPPLCLRALHEFLNILQGQSPAGLRNEPKETTGVCMH